MKRHCFGGLFIVLLLAAGGCRKAPPPAPAPAPPAAPEPDLYILVPAPGGASSAIVVANSAGSTVIDKDYHAVRVAGGAAPSAATPITPEEVRRLAGPVLDALPLAEASFTLYFDTADTLTAESRALVSEIVRAVQERRSTLVSIVGHTDTVGTAESNRTLGLQRAQTLVSLLEGAGVPRASLRVTSHGEADPATPTADEVREPRNRRVEVVVR